MGTTEKHKFIAEIKSQWRITITPTIRALLNKSNNVDIGDYLEVEVTFYRKKE